MCLQDKIGEIKYKRDKIHLYLMMTLDYSTPSKLEIDMKTYFKEMIDDFPQRLSGKAKNVGQIIYFQ